jgi:hypothetical protein
MTVYSVRLLPQWFSRDLQGAFDSARDEQPALRLLTTAIGILIPDSRNVFGLDFGT